MRLRALVVASSCALVCAGSASAAMLDAGPRAVARVPDRPLDFARPMRGPLESGFGYRWGRLHSGQDIAVLQTNRVHAAESGRVVEIGWLNGYAGYGNVVRIRHRRGVVTLYAHLASIAVRPGEWVSRGEPIARAGCTGSCTGPHLHFEIRLNGRPVNPAAYLR